MNLKTPSSAIDKPAFIEFDTLSDEIWRVEMWPDLADRFDLLESQMKDFHRVLSGQGRPWKTVKRLYGICPVFGAHDPDEMRAWSMAEIAKDYGLPEKQILKEIAATADFWKQQEQSIKMSHLLKTDDDADDGDIFQIAEEDFISDLKLYDEIDEDKVTAILKQLNFHEKITDPHMRNIIADRAISLMPWLRQKNLRTTAREILRLEIDMNDYENIRAAINRDINRLAGEEKIDQEKVNTLQDRLMKLDNHMKSLSSAHADKIEALGANEIDTTQKKQIFIETIGYLAERMKEYYADPDKSLIDGIFTPNEVVWLLTPTKLREPQYRPDIVARLMEAMQPENLWNPDYKPTSVQREASRRLLKIVKHFDESVPVATIAGIDDVNNDEDEDETPTQDIYIDQPGPLTDQSSQAENANQSHYISDDDGVIA